jgi:hypothetical protein
MPRYLTFVLLIVYVGWHRVIYQPSANDVEDPIARMGRPPTLIQRIADVLEGHKYESIEELDGRSLSCWTGGGADELRETVS